MELINMDGREAANRTQKISTLFWNWTEISDYDKNINTDQHEEDDDLHDITELVIVGSFVVIILLLYVLQRHRDDQWTRQGCGFMWVKSGGDVLPSILNMHSIESDSKINCIDEPPPPYEEPPSYNIAVGIEE
jgi:hypothetical protein